jgi:stage III sporulation protein AE
MEQLLPNLSQGVRVCAGILATLLILSLLKTYEGKSKAIADLCGVVSISYLLLSSTQSLIRLGADTVASLSQYGKLLIPVMATALAAQGGSGSAASLCTATVFFDSVLGTAISDILIPGVYIYLAVAITNAAVGDAMMKKMADFLKWLLSWALKIVLYTFTGYMSITGLVAGTADQTALKAAKLTLGGIVPVVGSILSDASETILVGAAVVKNSVGIYGLLVLLALVIGPFIKIGVQYLLMKLTAAICGLFSDKSLTTLLEAFSSAMGLLLAMTGTVCLLFMISVMCILRGIGI